MRILGLIWRHPLLALLAASLAFDAIVLALLVPPTATATADDATAMEESGEPSRAEFSLGDFQVRNFQTPGRDYLVKFGICLTVDDRGKEELHEVYRRHEQRVREAIGIAVRKADSQVLTEPTLATLKRRLRVAILAAMSTPEPRIADVLIPDFTINQG